MSCKFNPIMLWICPHLVLRYEEVPLFIEAGAEVIPSLGNRDILSFDHDYDDEANELYPNWRSFCSLPSHIVEKIRRINVDTPTEEEAAFMNKWVDAIYIASFPKTASNILKWYTGTVVFRGFGGFKSYAEMCKLEGVELRIFEEANDRFIWSPILKALTSIEDARLTQNEAYIPAFVSKQRLPFEWTGENSETIISTVIPYIHTSEKQFALFQMFDQAFNGTPYVVLGKNDKSSKRCEHPSILGNVDFSTLWSRLCHSRLLCYGGFMTAYHLHFTPLEAMTIGVPILFLEQCGITPEALEHGIQKAELFKLGMCRDLPSMRARAEQLKDDIDKLNELRQLQRQWLLPVFSRDRALKLARKLIVTIHNQANERRKNYPLAPILPHVYSDPIFSNNLITRVKLPGFTGEYRIWDARYWEGSTGTTEWDSEHHAYVRSGKKGIHLPGLLVNNRMSRLASGKYEVVVTIETNEAALVPDAYFQLGAFSPDYINFTTFSLHRPNKAGLIDVQNIFTVPEPEALAIVYMQISWLGQQSIRLIKILLRKLADVTLPVASSEFIFRWRESFSFLENNILGCFRWCGSEGILEIENRSSSTKIIELRFGLQTALPVPSKWSLMSELWNVSLTISGKETIIEETLNVPTGTYFLEMHCDAPELVPNPINTRAIVFRINNFEYKDLS